MNLCQPPPPTPSLKFVSGTPGGNFIASIFNLGVFQQQLVLDGGHLLETEAFVAFLFPFKRTNFALNFQNEK